VVILGCKPQMYQEILGEEGMAAALEGKLLVSILAGVKIEQLKAVVPGSTRVVRAMPNTASKVSSLPPPPPGGRRRGIEGWELIVSVLRCG
jgi:pyrroline-5-carboxylate reductase